MELQPFLEAAAGEVIKAAGAQAGGIVVSGSRRLLALVERAFGSRFSGGDLREQVIHRAAGDPAFADELTAALAECGTDLYASPALLPIADFENRDDTRARLRRQPGIHLLAGAPGGGKTALAGRVAADAAPGYPNGVAYVDCDDFRDGRALRIADVQRAVIRQFGIDAPAESAAEVQAQYLSILIRCRCVLIIDNVVDRTEASALAPPLAYSLVLVTTRHLSQDLREWTPTAPIVLAGVDQEAGRRLLEARCRPEMLQEDDAATQELLERCDYLPYYLRMAGARLARRAGEPGAVADYLRELGPGAPGEELLARAFAELSPAARASAGILAHHPGADFTRTSATAMLGGPSGSAVDELIDAVLIVHQSGGRLRLSRPARAYARRIGGDVDEAFRRVAEHYRDRALAADADPGRLRRYQRPTVVPAWPEASIGPIAWLDAEAEVIVALVHEAYERQEFDVAVTQLCGVLEVLFNHRGQARLCVAANETGIRSARRLGDRVLQARIVAMQGRILTTLHLFDDAGRALADARALLDGVDDPLMRSSLGEFVARWHEELARHDPAAHLAAAIDGFQECVRIDRHIGHTVALGIHLRMLANALVAAGRAAEAPALLEEAAGLSPSTRNAGRIAVVHAKALTELGQLSQARQRLAHAGDLFRQSGATQYEDELAELDGEIAFRAGDVERARTTLGWLLQRTFQSGHPRYWAYLRRLTEISP